MQRPTYTLLLIISALSFLVNAAPQDLSSRIRAYLQSQGVNATIPNTAYAPQAQTQGASGSLNIALTCGILNAYRDANLVTPQDGQLYTVQAEQHWSPTAWGHPNCIFEPTTVREVQFFVGLLRITGTTYAIRSGGHSPFKGFATTDNGVLIAMHKMKDVVYDAKTETVRMAMGNTWGDVYGYLNQFQRIVVGGRLAPVGMALVTGGGLSHYSNEKGFAGDNVVNFEMVLADGRLINANATSNSDLWWAMKAGQNNFGITTHITTKAYPMGAVWGGLRTWNASQLDAVSDAFAEYQREGQLDTKSSVIPDLVPTNGTLFITLIYFGPVTTRPKAFDAFYRIPAIADDSKAHPNFLDLISVGPPQVVPRFSYGFSSLYLDNSTTYRDVMRLCAAQSEKMKRVNGGTQVLIPQPISKTMVDAAAKTGGRPQTLQPRAQLWMNMSWGWNLAKDDAYVYALIKETYEKVDQLAKSRGLYDPYIFLNDAFPDQKVFRSYGAESFKRMKEISRKYDPTQMFQKQVPGGFKLD
ncbi:MAG: hypothetical protein LQ339_007748 [Xanthoria mediterranea]|nr:MAG: hypothetical protein LQ339_007748 [Xanthoria mediterranea]